MTRPYVVTISSEKGGVGKTTLATNLAIYLKARDAALPVTLFSFDNHFSVDRMFGPNRPATGKDVCGLFDGIPLNQLAVPGDYGVQYVASSQALPSRRTQAEAVDCLTRTLLASQIEGIVIIDTRPDLDVFTQNALAASDRVIVPVKDAPSLENCRHLFDFFDRQHLSRSAIKLLPSLVDARIRYEGPFKDPYQLLRGYAINRGYPCYELYIAKSPKVESLATNPSGRIHPILTHGRQTEVHQQMCQLTVQIYDDMTACQRPRLQRAYASFATTEALEKEAFHQRLQTVDHRCLICGASLETAQQNRLFYGETPAGHRGMVEEACLFQLLFAHVRHDRTDERSSEQLLQLFREAAARSLFVIQRPPGTEHQLALLRFTLEGNMVSQSSADLESTSSHRSGEGAALYPYLLERVLGTDTDNLSALVLQQADVKDPSKPLQAAPYQIFQQRMARITGRLAGVQSQAFCSVTK